MRILLLCYEFPPLGGGGSRVCEGLARALAVAGHEVEVVTSRSRGQPASAMVAGVRVRRIWTLRRRIDRSDAFELAIYALMLLVTLLRERPDRGADVCHVHFVFPDGLVAWLMRRLVGSRYLLTAHGSDVPGYNPSRFRGLHRLLRPVWLAIVRGADGVVCASAHLDALLRRADPLCRPLLIPNGLDADGFRPRPVRRAAILCVSRLFDRKGVHHLLHAVADADLGLALHIVGDGPERGPLERLAQGSRTPVRFHGWIDNRAPELRDLLETIEVFVLPSTAENFPVCLLEAMAAGMAIVTTGDTGCADVVGDTGLLVPSGDPLALRRALERLAADPGLRAELGRRARARFERHFTWPMVARRHVELYRASMAPARAALPLAQDAPR